MKKKLEIEETRAYKAINFFREYGDFSKIINCIKSSNKFIIQSLVNEAVNYDYTCRHKIDNINEIRCDGRPLLTFASEYNNIFAIEQLLNQGVDVNAGNSFGETALHYAAFRGHIDALSFLLEEDEIILDIQDNMNRTPLHYASLTANYSAAETLLKHGANPFIKNKKGEDPLESVNELINIKLDKKEFCGEEGNKTFKAYCKIIHLLKNTKEKIIKEGRELIDIKNTKEHLHCPRPIYKRPNLVFLLEQNITQTN